ncbi:MAG: LamG domain-containing protein [Proteobacteria bacterium]|nr:LamG domain-containing protein [Pseudomonadota bacterium]
MIRAIGIALLAGVALAACGGGAQTSENPQSTGGGDAGDAPYAGPVAKDDDVLNFQQNFWNNTRTSDRCGACHTPGGGQAPYFVRSDDVNLAYDEAVPKIDRSQPSLSEFVTKVGDGHNCWVADSGTCAAILTTWIENWVGAELSGGRQIVLTPPPDNPPSDSLAFPPDAGGPPSFETIVWQPYLRRYCSACHATDADPARQQTPFHSDVNVEVAYDAAKPKIDLEFPENSQLVERVRQGHNSWTGNFDRDADDLEAAIRRFAGLIGPTEVDPALVTSNEVTLLDGVLASGGNRYENDQIALWEFRTGEGSVAYDTSGVDPAIDLNFSGDVSWYGGWGVTIGSDMALGGPGKLQAPTTTSRKLHDIIVESGEFSIEAWIVPANVTQETARIVSYSAGRNSRNVTLQQTLYNYDFLLRTNAQDAQGDPLTTLDGDPQLSTPDADEVLQATLQHVVATYDPIDGRRIYVNGVLATQTDPVPGGTLVDWQDNMALILGNEADSSGLFEGTFRLAAIHRRALSEEQIGQNYDAGVGERFYLLFNISDRIGLPAGSQIAYILFEAQQFDSFAYLFDKPHFITLDGSTPSPVPMAGMRIAMNGREAPVGQSYANIVQSLDLSDTAALTELGQPLSSLGAVLPLQQGPEFDKFFLTFDNLDGVVFDRPQDPMLVVADYIAAPDAASPDIGVKTFDEIDATYAAITGIDRIAYRDGNGDFAVDQTYRELRQSLPAVESIEAFLSSHQVAIAQLAIQYCDAAVEDNTLWPGLDFDTAQETFFSAGNRDAFVEPLILHAIGHSSTSPRIGTQPSYADVHGELASFPASGDRPENLIDRLLAGSSDTRAIAKGVCAAALGSAATLLQ